MFKTDDVLGIMAHSQARIALKGGYKGVPDEFERQAVRLYLFFVLLFR